MHALILAGGKGTRLAPLTDTRPKPLVPFCGEPFAAGLLRRLAAAGVTRVTFLIAQDPAPFAALDPLGAALGVRVEAVTEETPLDTAGAVRRLLAGGHDQPVLVCNGDVLTDLDFAALAAAHAEADAAATLALTRVDDTASYGVVVCDDHGRVRRFVEKPAPGTVPDDTVNAGTYVLAPGVFDHFAGDGPLSFEREVFPGLLQAGAVLLGCVSDAYWADLGTPQRYLDGTRAVVEGRCGWPVAETLRRVPGGLVAADAQVDGQVAAASVVHAGCAVASGARVHASVLFPSVRVGAGAQVVASIVGEGAEVADGASVGPGAVVADAARVA